MQTELLDSAEEILSIMDYKQELLYLCVDKAEEFRHFGYGDVSSSDIFQCAKALVQKNERLHELVGTILTLRVNQFMNYATKNAYKGIFDDESV